jgi:hypothetical protein
MANQLKLLNAQPEMLGVAAVLGPAFLKDAGRIGI